MTKYCTFIIPTFRNMKKKVIVASVVILLICSAFTLVKQWKVDKDNSTINFELPALNKKGTFGNLNAVIDFDEKDLQKSKITASIDAKTINTGSEKHDDHLRSADYFNVEKYPTILFASTEIVKRENGYLAKGILTIRDSIKPIDLPFTYSENGKNKAVFSGTITINGSDYGILKANSPGSDKVVVYLTVPVSE